MVHEGLATLLNCLEVLRPALTMPSFINMQVLFAGWILTSGQHAVTQALVVTSVAGRRHHEAFHRFFSRGTWSPDEMGRLLFDAILQLVPDGYVIPLILDDTLAPKKGAHVFGIGSHLDAVRSTKRQKIFSFGHCWVVLAVSIPVPFSARTWALPILFRLYRTVKECERKQQAHRKKTELARDMLDVAARWAPGRRLELSADAAYCNDTVLRGLSGSVVLFGAMRPDAVLTAPPPPRSRKGGRPRSRGKVLPKPEALARNARHPWEKCRADLYGKEQTVEYKTCIAQWYRPCGTRLVKVVIVKVESGSIGIRVFFSTDYTLSVRDVLEGYADRWAIEICFRDLKQLMGFADSSARKEAAVLRTAPFVGIAYSVLILWSALGAHQHPFSAPPLRPWYQHKRGLSFADVLRSAQRVLSSLDVLDPASSLDNLRETLRDPSAKPISRLKRAA
jgi:DDE superfamily endonuclease